MITDVLIRNFKCFKSITVPEFGRITLIGGRNNVGKTAFLEALFLFLDHRNPGMTLHQYSRRGVEKISGSFDSMWNPMFNDPDQEIFISVAINGSQKQMKFRFNREFVPPAPNTVQHEDQHISTEAELAVHAVDIEYSEKSGEKFISHHFADPNNKSMPTLIYKKPISKISLPTASFLASKKHNPTNELSKQFSNLSQKDRENEAVEFLKIIATRLEKLKNITESGYSTIHGKLKGESSTRRINFMGEGMEKLLSIILAIEHSTNHIIFLDEIENGLHYSVMPKIWKSLGKALLKYDCQLITTTHSYECLKAAHEGLSEMQEDFRYIRLHRKGNEFSAKLSNYDMIGTAIETNQEVR